MRYGSWVPPIALLLLAAGVGLAADGIRVEGPRERAFLGVRIADAGHDGGVEIVGVIDGSAAERIDLRRGDVIVDLDGAAIAEIADLTQEIGRAAPGATVSVTVLRDGDERTYSVDLGRTEPRTVVHLDRPFHVVSPHTKGTIRGTMTLDPHDDLDQIFVCEGDACMFSGDDPVWLRLDCVEPGCERHAVDYWKRPVLGVEIVEATSELQEFFGSDGATGVLIARVFGGSPAEDAGLRVGDLVVEIEGQPIRDASDLRQAVEEHQGSFFEITVIRDQRAVALDAELP